MSVANPSVVHLAPNECWRTPLALFDRINDQFQFTLDAAADAENALCSEFYTREQDALIQPWFGHRVWCNPPYGSENLTAFVRKAAEEYRTNGVVTVMLVPSNTTDNWFHQALDSGAEPRFIQARGPRGGTRVQFDPPPDCKRSSNPGHNMLLVWGGKYR